MAYQNIVDSWTCGNKDWVFRQLEKITDKADFVLWMRRNDVPKDIQFEIYEWFFWKTGKVYLYIDVEGP